jgi:uncharacterized protein
MKKIATSYPIITFLLITFSLSSIFYSLIIHVGQLGGGFNMYVTGLMWCPGIAALLTSKISGRAISLLGWQWGQTKYQIRSYLIPLLYAFITYLIIWSFGWGGFYNDAFITEVATSFGWTQLPKGLVIVFSFIIIGIFGMARSSATAMGEEIGWRGFLVPELSKRYSYTQTSIIVGLIWSVWHFPILIFADYNSGTPYWYGLSCFTVMVTSISFIYAWFRLKSNSLWTGVILHASHNLFIQSIFTPITKDTGNTKYFIDEFGIVLPIVCLCFAIYFWSKRAELSSRMENLENDKA